MESKVNNSDIELASNLLLLFRFTSFHSMADTDIYRATGFAFCS